MVPITFPFTSMLTPIRASSPSVTFPEIVVCWEYSLVDNEINNTNERQINFDTKLFILFIV